MIVKIHSNGKSFSGLATYLTHDAEAKTAERVAWTHTLNMANDHIPSAVDEMLWTARNAELLKQEAGVRAGGRAMESEVKHLSLNWSPEDDPSHEHMIKTTEEFLRHMKWQEHQAVLVAHDDKEYAHVHVMLNTVHPETGRRLNDGFERRRAQAWALEYEREQGRIYCEERLKNVEDREDSPTRPAWMAFAENQRKFEAEEKILEKQNDISADGLEIPENSRRDEWKRLKEIQKNERIDFFGDGKAAFSELRNSIYREVREEFRERWNAYYTAERDGGDSSVLATLKAGIVAEQQAAIETRRDEACTELRATRDGLYRDLLDHQREIRHGLRERQDAGLENSGFFEAVRDGRPGTDLTETFRGAAAEMLEPHDVRLAAWADDDAAFEGTAKGDNAGMKSGLSIGDSLGEGVGFFLLSFLGGVADGITGSKPAPPPRHPEPNEPATNPLDAVIADARKRQQLELEKEDEEWRKRQRSYGE